MCYLGSIGFDYGKLKNLKFVGVGFGLYRDQSLISAITCTIRAQACQIRSYF